MSVKNVSCGLTVIVFSLFHLTAWAYDIYSPTGEPIPEKMDQEEARLNLLNSRTDEVVSAHGRYAMVRDTLYLGSTGINQRATKWFADATIWLTTLDNVASAFQENNISLLATATVRNQLRTEINKSYMDFQKLAREALEIRQISQKSLNELEKVRRFPAPFVADFDAPIIEFVSKINKLENGIISVNNTVNTNFINSTNFAIQKTKEVSKLMLKNALLNTQYAAISNELQSVQAALLAESIFAPLYAELLDIKIEINSLINNSMVLTAQTRLTDMELKSQTATDILNSSGLTTTETQSAIDKITQLTAQARNNVALVINSPATAVLRLYKTTTGTPVLYCKYPFGQKKYNCQLLKSLGGLTDQDILTMSNLDLKFLEDSLKRVYDGPLGAATGGI